MQHDRLVGWQAGMSKALRARFLQGGMLKCHGRKWPAMLLAQSLEPCVVNFANRSARQAGGEPSIIVITSTIVSSKARRREMSELLEQ